MAAYTDFRTVPKAHEYASSISIWQYHHLAISHRARATVTWRSTTADARQETHRFYPSPSA
jgi:hypothetical protein